jgi:hypothetical protein
MQTLYAIQCSSVDLVVKPVTLITDGNSDEYQQLSAVHCLADLYLDHKKTRSRISSDIRLWWFVNICVTILNILSIAAEFQKVELLFLIVYHQLIKNIRKQCSYVQSLHPNAYFSIQRQHQC